MQIKHLCAKHAEWVYGHPVEALHYLARDELQGELLLLEGCFREAIPYLGCAFDIALLLYELEEGQNPLMAEKVISLATSLHRSYQKVRAAEHAMAVLLKAVTVLTPGQVPERSSLTPADLLVLLSAAQQSVSAQHIDKIHLRYSKHSLTH